MVAHSRDPGTAIAIDATVKIRMAIFAPTFGHDRFLSNVASIRAVLGSATASPTHGCVATLIMRALVTYQHSTNCGLLFCKLQTFHFMVTRKVRMEAGSRGRHNSKMFAGSAVDRNAKLGCFFGSHWSFNVWYSNIVVHGRKRKRVFWHVSGSLSFSVWTSDIYIGIRFIGVISGITVAFFSLCVAGFILFLGVSIFIPRREGQRLVVNR